MRRKPFWRQCRSSSPPGLKTITQWMPPRFCPRCWTSCTSRWSCSTPSRAARRTTAWRRHMNIPKTGSRW